MMFSPPTNHRYLVIKVACWPRLPVYFDNLVHPLSTTKMAPLTHLYKRHEQKKLTTPPYCLFVGGSLAPLFIVRGQTVNLKPISFLVTRMSMLPTHVDGL